MGVCQLTHVISPISLLLIQLRPYSRVRRADRGNRRWTGATPLFAARIGHGGVAQLTFAQHPLGGRSRPNCPWREGHKKTPVTGKMARMSTPDIHEQRLEALRKQAMERLHLRRAYRCPDCGYRSFQRDCSRCDETCETASRAPS